MAVIKLIDVAETGDGDPFVAEALVEIAKSARLGERHEDLILDFRSDRGARPVYRTAKLGRARSRQLSETVERARTRSREDTVIGVLVEADFERHSARLRGQLGEAVTVSFDEDLADDVHRALRGPATVEGEVAYDPATHAARSVRVRNITRGRQLAFLEDFDPETFWKERTFDELAAAKGGVITDQPEEIYNAEASDAERDAFMAALAELAE